MLHRTLQTILGLFVGLPSILSLHRQDPLERELRQRDDVAGFLEELAATYPRGNSDRVPDATIDTHAHQLWTIAEFLDDGRQQVLFGLVPDAVVLTMVNHDGFGPYGGMRLDA